MTKRSISVAACVSGLVALALLIPLFNAAQPQGIRLTRGDAVPIADAAARQLGIPVDKAWATLSWSDSRLLSHAFETNPDLLRKASTDPALGPRMAGYDRTYYRRGLEKSQPYGHVVVNQSTGQVTGARLRLRTEEPGAQLTEAELRPRADAFVRLRPLPGAPSPRFESARPNVMRTRTDWTFRYRVRTTLPTGNVVPYLNVYFAGNQFTGWELSEEYADGSAYRGDTGGGVAALLGRMSVNYALLLILIIIFLKKYHAGEVGVGTGSMLFGTVVLIALVINYLIGAASAEGSQLGSLDAEKTAAAQMAFKFLLYDLPFAVVVFFAWAVGESYARERWGERLASFDSILRRDPLNATAGRSVLYGVLFSPAVAGAAFIGSVIPLLLKTAHVTTGTGTDVEVGLGGPVAVVLFALLDAVIFPIISLFLLAWTHRLRVLPLGVIAAVAVGMIGAVCDVPTEPFLQRLLFDFGGIAAIVSIFLGFDLLTTAVALFGGTMISMVAPLLSVSRGHMRTELIVVLAVPLVLALGYSVAALLSRREVVYKYEDLAPHVKRIVERERVKAEIDAANRIQAALLPMEAPLLAGASVASHYRAATEIGGDYFDFLPQPSGEIGIAFGDVSGHGLTSGIVMAMAKSALLVQVEYDSSPRAVMNVLNDIVMKTAPKRILMTFFFGLLDPYSQTLRFSSAGHLDPYVYRASSRRIEPLSSWGFPLGVKRREAFREHSVEFAVGDKLILYSDGLIEALDDDGEPYGFERFEKTLLEHGTRSADEIKKALLNSVRKFTRNRPPEDDQTLVVVSFDEAVGRMIPLAEGDFATHMVH
jgi:serine phosphatase RsbU (regulator of sigma subunit)